MRVDTVVRPGRNLRFLRNIFAVMATIGLILGMASWLPRGKAAAGRATLSFAPTQEQVPIAGAVSIDGTSNGAANLSYTFSVTCEGAVGSCTGATITLQAPEGAFKREVKNISSDRVKDQLIGSPRIGNNAAYKLNYDTSTGKITITVLPGWTVDQVESELYFQTNASYSAGGPQPVTARLDFEGQSQMATATVNLIGEMKPGLSKKSSDKEVQVGNIISYTITNSFSSGKGTQRGTGVVEDKLPDGVEFIGFITNDAQRKDINLRYDADERSIKYEWGRQYGSYSSFTVEYAVRITDTYEANTVNKITNSVTARITSFDGLQNKTLTADNTVSVATNSSPATFSKTSIPFGMVSLKPSFSSWDVKVDLQGDPRDLTLVDIPTSYEGDIPWVPLGVQVEDEPLQFREEDGQLVPYSAASTVTYYYTDGTKSVVETPSKKKNNILYKSVGNPRNEDRDTLRVTRIEITIHDALPGSYSFTLLGEARITEKYPDGYKVENCVSNNVGVVALGSPEKTIDGQPATCAFKDTPAKPKLSPMIKVGVPELSSWDAGTPIDFGEKSWPFSFVLSNEAAGGPGVPTRPDVFLTAPQGFKIDFSNPRNGYSESRFERNGCQIRPDQWIFEDLGNAAPNGSHKVKATLKEGVFLGSTFDNSGDGIGCGTILDLVRDPSQALEAGDHSNRDLRSPLAALSGTVYEPDQENYVQRSNPKLDVYNVTGLGTNTKIHQDYYPVLVPRSIETALSTSAHGDRNAEGEFGAVGTADLTGAYRITAGSRGSVPLTDVVVYDFLPREQYTGLTNKEENGQGSTMIPTLRGPVEPIDGADVTVLYSTELNPCRPEIGGSACADGAEVDPSFVPWDQVTDKTKITSIRIAFNGDVNKNYNFDIPVDLPTLDYAGNPLAPTHRAFNYAAMSVTPLNPDGTKDTPRPPIGPSSSALQYRPKLFVDKQVSSASGQPVDTVEGQDEPIVAVGQEYTYTLTAVNPSAKHSVADVKVVDQLPAGITVVSADPAQGTFDEQTGVWDVGLLPVGAKSTLELRVTAGKDTTDPVINKAWIIQAEGDDAVQATQPTDQQCAPHEGALTDCDSASVTVDTMQQQLGGTYFRDGQADGQPGSNVTSLGDAPMPGQEVTLHYLRGDNDPAWLDAQGNEITEMTTTTDAQGNYLFTGLVHGRYEVEFRTTEGWPWVTPDQGGDENTDSDAAVDVEGNPLQRTTQPITVNYQDTITGVNAGVRGDKGTLSGVVYAEKDTDGLAQTEPMNPTRIPGAQVTLLTSDGTVVSTPEGTITTGEDGTWTFTNIDAGDYHVAITLPDGWTLSAARGQPQDAAGVNDTIPAADAGDNPGEGTIPVTLVAGGSVNNLDTVAHGAGKIAGMFFNDVDDNGVRSGQEETPVEGVTVYLFNEAHNVIGETTTDAEGSYTFANLAPGTYQVQFQAQDNQVISSTTPQPMPGQIVNTAQRTSTPGIGLTPPLALAPGAHNTTVNASSTSADSPDQPHEPTPPPLIPIIPIPIPIPTPGGTIPTPGGSTPGIPGGHNPAPNTPSDRTPEPGKPGANTPELNTPGGNKPGTNKPGTSAPHEQSIEYRAGTVPVIQQPDKGAESIGAAPTQQLANTGSSTMRILSISMTLLGLGGVLLTQTHINRNKKRAATTP